MVEMQSDMEGLASEGLDVAVSRVPKAKNVLKRSLNSVAVLGAVLFVFSTSFPPFDALTELNLGAHMVQHVLIAFSGVLIAYPFYRAGKFDRIKRTETGVLGLAVVGSMLIAWHIPFLWTAAVQNFSIHFVEHLSFLLAGLLIGGVLLMLPDNFKLLIMAFAISAHDIYGFALYLTPTQIYPPSPVDQQAFLGFALFAPSPIYFFVYLIFSLTRQNRTIEEKERSLYQISRDQPKNYRRTQKIVPVLTILMLILLGGYFATTSIAIFALSSQANGTSGNIVVYIVESPLYWQYSPQNIRVVIGVNNTVTWVSRSYTVDTVTSDDGSFASQVVSPGGTWHHTFDKPGTYSYHCQYHPWMKGTVTVLSS